MSYDLAVWHVSRPITTEEAADIYDRLGEPDLTGVELYPGVSAFMAELTAQYPQIDDWPEEDIDNCPWSVQFEHSDSYVVICMSHSRVSEIVPIVEEFAAKHDLVCFNPQWPCVVYPPRIAAMPHMRLTLQNWTLIDNPTSDQISDAISSLNAGGNAFAILEKTDATYFQTFLEPTGEYIVEYQDGSLDEHYKSSVFDMQQLITMFQSYAAGGDTWKQQCDWSKMEL